MCFDYEGPSAIWEEIYRKARKPHHCTGCARGIKAGEHYWYGSSLYDGNWQHTNECEACRYHRALIYATERSEGCAEHESWVFLEQLEEELDNRGWHVPDMTSDTWAPEDGEHAVVRFGEWQKTKEEA